MHWRAAERGKSESTEVINEAISYEIKREVRVGLNKEKKKDNRIAGEIQKCMGNDRIDML